MSIDFTFDGVLASTKGFTTHNTDKDPLERMDRTFMDMPGYPGAIELTKKFPKRIVGCDGRLVGSSYNNLTATIVPAFSAYLYTNSDVRLKFSDESDRFYTAHFHRFKRIIKYSQFRLMDLEFECSWPFAENVTADDNTQSGATKGFTWTETNNGHIWAYPTITITFNQSQSHIYIANNDVSGNRFDIKKSFVNTDVLVINSKTLVVGLNGSVSPAGIGDGGNEGAEYPILDTGGNQLEVGTDDGTLDVDVRVVYRKTYLS